MAPTSTALTTKVESGSPYQLDPTQTLTASSALLRFLATSKQEETEKSGKRSLITGEEEEEQDDETAIWLLLTTKRHIVDQKRLKPSKITLPHPAPISSNATICLIVADPQRTYKDIVASPAFPAELAARIGRVIDVTKLEKKYREYEKLRQLRDEYDIFLADDRIITRLPKVMGKTFYKSTAKRPIPINMQAPAPRTEGKRIARAKGKGVVKDVIEPAKLAAEIEKTFKCALVALSPSTLTSVRVGRGDMVAEELAKNIETVANELVERFVPQKWRGVRSFHIKGPNTASMPIWLAEELWLDDNDVLENADASLAVVSTRKSNVGKKRKALEAPLEEPKAEKKAKAVAKVESNDTNLDKEIALRKEKLKSQKAEAAASVEADLSVPKPSKTKVATKVKKNRSVSA